MRILNDKEAMEAIGILRKYPREEVIKAMEKKSYRIFGSEVDFNFETNSESELTQKALDVWMNPDKYSDYGNECGIAYYEFLKFIWIKYPNGKEIQLAAWIDEHGK